jgi:small-conductance mechanosensitive channel
MNILDPTLEYLDALIHQLWVRDLALLVAGSAIAYLPGWFSVRFLQKYRKAAWITRSRALRIAEELLEIAIWPLWALLLLYAGFRIWVAIAPESAGDPFRILAILWFFLLYRILSGLTKEILPPGDRRRRIRRGVLPIVLVLAALQQLGLLGLVLGWLGRPLLRIGGTMISALSFLIAVGVAAIFVLAGRLAGAFLGSRFLPGLGVDRPLSESLGTIFRYFLVGLGIFVAVDTLGFDLSALKIAFGALGVGIGFGLQGVVNNFVSGLIMLIERTVKRGDIVKVGGTDGRVISIGLRSSVVRTRGGHEIIVPNSDLVGSQVTNFSYRDQLIRVDIPVGVSYAADPNQVRDLLLQAAAEEGPVLDSPQSEVIFMGYGESSIDFELRAWIDDPWHEPQVRSALYFSIWYKLKGANIEIPFPQRDLHVRSGELKVRVDEAGKTPGVPEKLQDQ